MNKVFPIQVDPAQYLGAPFWWILSLQMTQKNLAGSEKPYSRQLLKLCPRVERGSRTWEKLIFHHEERQDTPAGCWNSEARSWTSFCGHRKHHAYPWILQHHKWFEACSSRRDLFSWTLPVWRSPVQTSNSRNVQLDLVNLLSGGMTSN